MTNNELLALRHEVDAVDNELVKLLTRRFAITAEIGKLKSRESLSPIDLNREAAQIERYKQLAAQNGINPEFLGTVFRVVSAGSDRQGTARK